MKQLFRPREDRIIGGVCAGLGRYLEVDPTLIRLAWAVFTLISLGTGILIYLAAWIIIPEDPGGPTP
jgi:phage shock protein PspC (stress-responsive transcriptional regulator)